MLERSPKINERENFPLKIPTVMKKGVQRKQMHKCNVSKSVTDWQNKKNKKNSITQPPWEILRWNLGDNLR